MRASSRKYLRIAALCLLLLGALLYTGRAPLLTAAGKFLVVSDPLMKADAIAILGGHGGIRAPKAAELYLQGWASKVLVDREAIGNRAWEVRPFGIYIPEDHEQSIKILQYLGVPASDIETLDSTVDSTAEEADVFLRHMRARGWTRLIVVTCNFHTRRGRTIFNRTFRKSGIRLSFQAAPPEWEFNPDQWWKRRNDSRILLQEYQKLIFYSLRYW